MSLTNKKSAKDFPPVLAGNRHSTRICQLKKFLTKKKDTFRFYSPEQCQIIYVYGGRTDKNNKSVTEKKQVISSTNEEYC